jgi:hypothetical protein
MQRGSFLGVEAAHGDCNMFVTLSSTRVVQDLRLLILWRLWGGKGGHLLYDLCLMTGTCNMVTPVYR